MKLVHVLALGLVLAVTIVVMRATAPGSRQVRVEPSSAPGVDEAAIMERLGGLVQIPTVSGEGDGQAYAEVFPRVHAYLERGWPLVHQRLTREVVATHSVLFTWSGSNKQAPAMVFMGHLDVVPVEHGTEDQWTHPPFSGRVLEGHVWGRGALDDKSGVVATLDAVEALLRDGYAPKGTVYLAFGHDEEVLGSGAAQIAALLHSRGVKPALVFDEGLPITRGIMPGISAPVAMIGVAQKGYVSVELTAQGEGGHSSMPPPETTVGIVARAVHRLQQHPMPARLGGIASDTFDYVAPEMPWSQRLVFANLWMFSPLIKSILLRKPSTAALLRTTTAPTILEGSVKQNVLPLRARAVVNFRIAPADRIADVLDHVKDVVQDERVTLRVLGTPSEPSPVAPLDSPHFTATQMALRQVDARLLVAPGLVIGATDARHYEPMTRDIYRFRAFELGPDDLSRVHGTNERISGKDLVRMARFVAQLIRNVDGP
jgi:carboxypeptidase PM20D1